MCSTRYRGKPNENQCSKIDPPTEIDESYSEVRNLPLWKTEENEKEERVEDADDEKKSRNMIPTPKTNIINL